MTPARVVPLRSAGHTTLARLREVRAGGDVPLIVDDRLPDTAWNELRDTVSRLDPDPAAAWATLTSGSSGAPRIVQRTSASWSDSFGAVGELLDAGADDVVALPAPPASSLTLFSLAHALAGGPRPILPREHALDAEEAAGATCFHGTPHALRSLLEAGAPPRMRTALVGGSLLDPALRERAEDAGLRVAAYYGAAELSFVAVDTGDGLRAFPGVELDVRDGELWVRSPFIALGYLHGPDAPAAGPLRRAGEWATVGDRAELAEGRLRLLGRADDAILSASATIVPEEVETVLRAVPGVRDAVVFALPRERVGALVAAAIEQEPGSAVAVDALKAATASLSPTHRPRQWFTAALPRTASGKPRRAEIARLAAAGEVRRLG